MERGQQPITYFTRPWNNFMIHGVNNLSPLHTKLLKAVLAAVNDKTLKKKKVMYLILMQTYDTQVGP